MLKRTKRTAVTAILLAVIVHTGPAAGQTDIHLSTGKTGGGLVPIVVRDLGAGSENLSGIAAYMTGVLLKDLSYTGVFDPLQFESGADGLSGGRTAAAIVEGAVSAEGERYYLDARLLDYTSREVIFSKRYSFVDAARRTVAHHLSDEILFFLMGETGVATTRLLFTRREGENKNLYMADYDGFAEKRITSGELVVSPEWLDAQRFCFTSYKRDNPDCYLIDLSGNTRTNISHRQGINIAGSWSAGNGELAVTLSLKGNSEIYLLKADGEIVRRLTDNRAIDCSPSWAPNGREIVFVSDRTGGPQLYVMDKYGGNTRRLTTRGSYNTSPAWSPGGDMIVYVSREGWRFQLNLIAPDGMWEEAVFEDGLSCEDPCWAPDGRHVAATVRYGGKPWIAIIDVETGNSRRLAEGESAAWSPLGTLR